ncbi:hypothetical protein [Alkalibacillus almallahensis]|uniref:hypothetical protein n=1 Tax=Alkalibacillus almallahensis TaxID=1379154 RepID=UPI0014209203|nr:hypothetical protein [Alkalibacillus almallahensis]NIK11154.1 hypothetical protein [Alkalibacillus almallahensis]
MNCDKAIEELAEKRTKELLGLKDQEVNLAKLFETTKQCEIIEIKREQKRYNKEYSVLRSLFF